MNSETIEAQNHEPAAKRRKLPNQQKQPQNQQPSSSPLVSPDSLVPSYNEHKRSFHKMTEKDVVRDVLETLGDTLTKVNAALLHDDDQETRQARALMTTFVAFTEAATGYFLHDVSKADDRPFATYMAAFSPEDQVTDSDPLLHPDVAFRQSLAMDIQRHLEELGVPREKLYDCMDTLFARFYANKTTHEHQKGIGQFFTPQNVVDFMWGRCLDHKNENQMPRVLDPCMGLGAFLCEFLKRWVMHLQVNGAMWDNPVALQQALCTDIPANVWGVELDPVALKLGKLNAMLHLLPLYRRLRQLTGAANNLDGLRIDRLHMFCNNTLLLTPTSMIDDPWEQHELRVLRTSYFDYVITNPPYMVQKDKRIATPDPSLYDESVLGTCVKQAYAFMIWFCLQRCDPQHGEVCFITPSHWMTSEHDRQLRTWMWENCEFLQLYYFKACKIWPRLNTDSMIFRLRMRGNRPPDLDARALYVRNTIIAHPLQDILDSYVAFDPSQPQPKHMKFKLTPTHDPQRIHQANRASLTFLCLPPLTDEINEFTKSMMRLCNAPGSPLGYTTGCSPAPRYGLVVRTKWALETFGPTCYARWFRPTFYWSSKGANSKGREVDFWRSRDPGRIEKRELPVSEAFVPFCSAEDAKKYSLIIVDKKGVDELEVSTDPDEERLYEYLQEAKAELQPTNKRKAIYSPYVRSGVDEAVKIIHPTLNGYQSKYTPRQRFFLDRDHLGVTDQCGFFTISPGVDLSPEFFCGLLNSSTLLYLLRHHCTYDQEQRMYFYERHLKNVPCCELPSASSQEAALMNDLVHAVTTARVWINAIVQASGVQFVVTSLRNCSWDIHPDDFKAIDGLLVQDFISSSEHTASWSEDAKTHWITQTLFARPHARLVVVLVQLLMLSSLFQFGIDQLAYVLYRLPGTLQHAMEEEMEQVKFREQWSHVTLDDIFDAAQSILQ